MNKNNFLVPLLMFVLIGVLTACNSKNKLKKDIIGGWDFIVIKSCNNKPLTDTFYGNGCIFCNNGKCVLPLTNVYKKIMDTANWEIIKSNNEYKLKVYNSFDPIFNGDFSIKKSHIGFNNMWGVKIMELTSNNLYIEYTTHGPNWR